MRDVFVPYSANQECGSRTVEDGQATDPGIEHSTDTTGSRNTRERTRTPFFPCAQPAIPQISERPKPLLERVVPEPL
jgi:hypothetical protein